MQDIDKKARIPEMNYNEKIEVLELSNNHLNDPVQREGIRREGFRGGRGRAMGRGRGAEGLFRGRGRGRGRGNVRGNGLRGRGTQNNSSNLLSEETPNDKCITSWSYYHLGDVEIPEICVYSIDNRCQFEKFGCKRLHAKCPCHWQMEYDGKWVNFRFFQSRELEESFQDPENDECNITPMDMKMLEPSARDLFKILGAEKWKANFTDEKLMIINNDSNSSAYNIRRLSTHSASSSKSSKAIVYEWYFLDKKKKWIRYGDTDSTGNVNRSANVTSDDIEKKFIMDGSSIFKFKSVDFEYELDFTKMFQRNLSTNHERKVRRRPQKRDAAKVHEPQLNKKENEDIPDHWDSMKESDSMIHVMLKPSQMEYTEVMKLLTAEITNVTIISIKRIQNPFLWRPLKNKMNELLLKYGTKDKLNIKQLFHGTKSDIIDNICKENFDWRLHGTSTGQVYGRGTYFSNSSAYSHNYSKCDSDGQRFMMVAMVIVGYTTTGNSSMTRPPLNPTTGMLYDTTVDNQMNPKIFVKYEKQEYYPEYVIEYTINPQNTPTRPLQQTPSNKSRSNVILNSRLTTQRQVPSLPSARTGSNSNVTSSIGIGSSTTGSSIITHEWLFLDDNSVWVKYGDVSSTNKPSVTSDDIELHFNNMKGNTGGILPFKFRSIQYQYELDFSKMTQNNLTTGKERAIVRKSKKSNVNSSSTTNTHGSSYYSTDTHSSGNPNTNSQNSSPTATNVNQDKSCSIQ